MEVGLGGRLDATNVVKPQVCVITSISFDHMDVLGDTLAKIAGEKAGIIKPGVRRWSARRSSRRRWRSSSGFAGRRASAGKGGAEMSPGSRATLTTRGSLSALKGLKGEYDLWIPLLGEHQLENAANAVAAAELLMEKGAKITSKNIVEGLKKVDWPGRLQVLRQEAVGRRRRGA